MKNKMFYHTHSGYIIFNKKGGFYMEIIVTDLAKEKLEELYKKQETNKSLRIYIAAYG